MIVLLLLNWYSFMREKSEKRRYYKRRNEKLPLILLPIISMNIYHLCRKVSHIAYACLLFKLWYTYSFVTHFFHSKISWLSFHVNEHMSLFHSIFNRCMCLPVGVTHPSSAPPSHNLSPPSLVHSLWRHHLTIANRTQDEHLIQTDPVYFPCLET